MVRLNVSFSVELSFSIILVCQIRQENIINIMKSLLTINSKLVLET